MENDIPSDVAAALQHKQRIRLNGTPCKWILPPEKVCWVLDVAVDSGSVSSTACACAVAGFWLVFHGDCSCISCAAVRLHAAVGVLLKTWSNLGQLFVTMTVAELSLLHTICDMMA